MQEKHLRPVWLGPGEQGVGAPVQWERPASFPATETMRRILFLSQEQRELLTLSDTTKGPFIGHSGGDWKHKDQLGSKNEPGLGRWVQETHRGEACC